MVAPADAGSVVVPVGLLTEEERSKRFQQQREYDAIEISSLPVGEAVRWGILTAATDPVGCLIG